jgi:hypothetical protein
MALKLVMEPEWKTDRSRRGVRVLELQTGDSIRVGMQEFSVVKIIGSCRFLVVPHGRRVGREV